MTVLTVTFPLFALVLAGFIAYRKGFLSAEGVKGIANFAFFFFKRDKYMIAEISMLIFLPF